jgi:hypothetical protein
MAKEMRLSTLNVDAQTSILAFLSHGDLVRFSSVSKQCHTVAKMDRLWTPLLARNFADIVLPSYQRFSSPASHFRVLAASSCYVCLKHLLSAEPRAEATRYLHPYSCGLCGMLRCSACHCQCHCLRAGCKDAPDPFRRNNIRRFQFDRRGCRGWAHSRCECSHCEALFCKACDIVFMCTGVCTKCEKTYLYW